MMKGKKMKNHDFILGPVDTDSISFCKPDFAPFSEEEQETLLNEINSLMEELIVWEHDGYYPRVVIAKSKNYILDTGEKIKFKGSAFKDAKKEKAMKEMMKEIGISLLDGINYPELQAIYTRYCIESINIKDIKRWCVKKTITKAIVDCATDPNARTNERKVWDAVKHTNPQEGDKVFLYDSIDGEVQAVVKGEPVFYKKTGLPKMVPNTILKLHTDFNNDTIPEKMLKRVFATLSIFKTVIDINQFIDYSKNPKLLDELFE